ncbi:hypothetical protein D3C72_2223320 [compost metagenome]
MHVVADDHGALEKCCLQRGSAAGNQRGVARSKHGVGLPPHDLYSLPQATRTGYLRDSVAQRGNGGHYQFDSWSRFSNKRCSPKEGLRYVFDL